MSGDKRRGDYHRCLFGFGLNRRCLGSRKNGELQRKWEKELGKASVQKSVLRAHDVWLPTLRYFDIAAAFNVTLAREAWLFFEYKFGLRGRAGQGRRNGGCCKACYGCSLHRRYPMYLTAVGSRYSYVEEKYKLYIC